MHSMQKPSQEMPQWWRGRPIVVPNDRTIHGLCRLPPGYRLAQAPENAALKFTYQRPENISPQSRGDLLRDVELASSYNVPKILISLIQACWAISTLYQACGDQIDRYGYAAFGLTVAPYAYMSVVNIFANLVTPEYSAMYLVSTPLLEEARQNGGVFDHIIGSVDVKSIDITTNPVEIKDVLLESRFGYWLSTLLALVPIALVGGLSGFHHGKSTSMQRGWTMSWLVVGIVSGIMAGQYYGRAAREEYNVEGNYWRLVFVFCIAWIPALGGLVIVGMMLKEYGSCILVG